jgi:hypothetical protein
VIEHQRREFIRPSGCICSGPSSCPYSPKCLEGVFSEVHH